MDIEIVYSQFLNQLVMGLLLLFGPPVIAWTLSKLRELYLTFKGHNPTLVEMFEEAVRVAVDAAESAGLTQLGLEKLNYAIEAAENYLFVRYKIKVDGQAPLKLLTDMIEAYLLSQQTRFTDIATTKAATKPPVYAKKPNIKV